MSTRAIIGIQNEDGSITGGWQWNDGMGLAPLLCRQFNTNRKIGGVIMTLKEFWNNANGVYDFINKNGETIDDMVYPLERIISW